MKVCCLMNALISVNSVIEKGWEGCLCIEVQDVPSSFINVHILNNQIGCAEVDERSGSVLVSNLATNHVHEFLLSTVLKDQSLIALDDLEAHLELGLAKLARHVVLERLKVTRSNIDHLLLVHITVHLLVLAATATTTAGRRLHRVILHKCWGATVIILIVSVLLSR